MIKKEVTLIPPFLWIILIAISCEPTGEIRSVTSAETKSDSTEKTTQKEWQPDSLEMAYWKGKYFFPNRLRLEGKNPGCIIFYDTSITDRERVDSADWKRYQDSIRPLLSPDVLRAHQAIWALPEMREEKCGPCGHHDRYTVYSVPEKTDSGLVYIIELYRDYYDMLRRTTPAHAFYYRASDRAIWVFDMAINDMAGDLVTLKAWRKWRKEKDIE